MQWMFQVGSRVVVAETTVLLAAIAQLAFVVRQVQINLDLAKNESESKSECVFGT